MRFLPDFEIGHQPLVDGSILDYLQLDIDHRHARSRKYCRAKEGQKAAHKPSPYQGLL
jgi:hypothetical protein